MSVCELCGKEESNLTETKVEGATLNVCNNCSSYGTVIEEENSKNNNSTKYDVGSTGTNKNTTTDSIYSSDDDIFEEDTLAHNYGNKIRQARQEMGLSPSDLASEINEKSSLIQRLENEESLPTSRVQRKLENKLDITLSESSE